MKRPLIIAASVASIGLAGAMGYTVANAATKPQAGTTLAQEIATRFNLKKDDVQKVFDEHHQTQQNKQESRMKDKLTALVKENKLTQDQADKITTKRAEMQKDREANREAMKAKTAAERQQSMEQHRTDLENWAKQNNIPTEYLHFIFGGGRGHGGMHEHGNMRPPAQN